MVQSRPCVILCLSFLVIFTPPFFKALFYHSFRTKQHLLYKDTAAVFLMATGKSTTSLPPPSTHTNTHTCTSTYLPLPPLVSFPSVQTAPASFTSFLSSTRSALSEQDRVGVLLDYQLLSADYTPHALSLRGNPWWRGEEVQRLTDRNGGKPRSTVCPMEGATIV